jgi:hypothetical protein
MRVLPLTTITQEVWATGFGQYGQLGDRAYVHLSTLRPVKDLRVLAPVEVCACVCVCVCVFLNQGVDALLPSVLCLHHLCLRHLLIPCSHRALPV